MMRKWTKSGLFTMERGYWHLQDKTQKGKMKKNNAINLYVGTSPNGMLEDHSGGYR